MNNSYRACITKIFIARPPQLNVDAPQRDAPQSRQSVDVVRMVVS